MIWWTPSAGIQDSGEPLGAYPIAVSALAICTKPELSG
jgi:hypothetical protein